MRIWCPDEVSPLLDVAIAAPDAHALDRGGTDAATFGFRTALDAERAIGEWRTFAALLESLDVVVHRIPPRDNAVGGENWHYPRDLAQVIGRTCYVASPATVARQHEARDLERFLRSLGVATVRCAPVVEFGDVVVAAADLVVAGYGTRSSLAGILELHDAVAAERGGRLLAVDVSGAGTGVRFAHLDLCFNVVGTRTALVYSALADCPATLHEGARRSRGALGELLAREGLRVLRVPPRMQDLAATNVLSVDPGRIVAYRAAAAAGLTELMAREGIEVVALPGSEMLKTGGGPRCMTMPLARA